MQLPYRRSKDPLQLLVDSTGIKVRGEGEWHARKRGGARRRVRRKVHLAVNEATLEVRAVVVTGSHVGHVPVFADLPGQIVRDEAIGSVTADGAYDTRRCHDPIAKREAHAVIPPRRNTNPWRNDSPGAAGRNDALGAVRRLGRTIRRQWSGCHRRSRVEARMNCVKLLGQRRMARDFDGKIAELQVRIAILNRYTAIGTPITQPDG